MSALSERARRLAEEGRRFLRWWADELCALVPQRFLPTFHQKVRVDLQIESNRVVIERACASHHERWIDERSLDQLDEESWDQLGQLTADARTRVWLSPPDVHATTLTLPRAARPRLRSAVALQLGEIAPLDSGLLAWEARVVPGKSDPLSVRVTMARADELRDIAARFAANGIPPPPVYAWDGDRPIRLAAGFDGARQRRGLAKARPMLAVLSLLLSIPVSTLVAAWLLTHAADSRSVSLQALAAPRLVAEARARRAEAARAQLAPLLRRPVASALVDDLADRLPVTASVKELSLDEEGKVRFTVATPDPDLVRPTLAGDPHLPGLRETAQSRSTDARIVVSFEAGGR